MTCVKPSLWTETSYRYDGSCRTSVVTWTVACSSFTAGRPSTPDWDCASTGTEPAASTGVNPYSLEQQHFNIYSVL